MRSGRFLGIGSLVIAAAAVALGADEYKIDAAHSSLLFKIKHLNVSNFYGRINDVSGTFVIDESDPEKCEFDITADVESIDTNNKKRDNHLKSPDFFSAKQFPKITFKSKSAKSTGENQIEVTGDLTCHGVTKSVAVQVELTGTGKGRISGYVAGFEAIFTIKRSEFGMKQFMGQLGDEVKILFSAEGSRD